MSATGFPSSSIWASLAGAFSAVGTIPFVSSDGVTPFVDPVNFHYTIAGSALSGSLKNNQLTVGGGLRVDYVDTTLGAPTSAPRVDAVGGRILVPIGSSFVTVNSIYATADSIILPILEDNDSGMTRIWVDSQSAGSFNIHGNAAAVAATQIAFIIFNVKTPGAA